MNFLRSWLTESLTEPALRAAAVFALALAAAFVIDRVASGVLRMLVRRTKSNLDDALIDALHRPVIVTMLLVGAWQALLLLYGLEPWDLDLPTPLTPEQLHALSPEQVVVRAEHRKLIETMVATRQVLSTLALLVWTGFGLRTGTLLLQSAAGSKHVRMVQPTSFPLFNHALKLLLFAFAIYLFLKLWSVDATGWLASAGVLGIVLGLAAQDSLANLFAGAFILADGPYKVGDYILLDSGERGRVTAIGLRSTRLLTRDDIEVIIPNSVMGQAKIVNETGGPAPMQRVRARVGVAYGSDLDLVQEELLAAAKDVSLIVSHPEPRVRFRSFDDSAQAFELLAWIPEAQMRGLALHQLNLGIAQRFDAAGIEIPLPQRVIRMETPTDS